MIIESKWFSAKLSAARFYSCDKQCKTPLFSQKCQLSIIPKLAYYYDSGTNRIEKWALKNTIEKNLKSLDGAVNSATINTWITAIANIEPIGVI